MAGSDVTASLTGPGLVVAVGNCSILLDDDEDAVTVEAIVSESAADGDVA